MTTASPQRHDRPLTDLHSQNPPMSLAEARAMCLSLRTDAPAQKSAPRNASNAAAYYGPGGNHSNQPMVTPSHQVHHQQEQTKGSTNTAYNLRQQELMQQRLRDHPSPESSANGTGVRTEPIPPETVQMYHVHHHHHHHHPVQQVTWPTTIHMDATTRVIGHGNIIKLKTNVADVLHELDGSLHASLCGNDRSLTVQIGHGLVVQGNNNQVVSLQDSDAVEAAGKRKRQDQDIDAADTQGGKGPVKMVRT